VPHLLSIMIHSQPGFPAASTFVVLAALTTIATVIVVASRARRRLRENATGRRSASGDGSTASLAGCAATDSHTRCGADCGGEGADGGGGGGAD
jgi:hypothetical protein